MEKYNSMKEYNGAVSVEGQMIEVKDGVVELDGEKYFVSKCGEFVIDSQRRLIGSIVPTFVPVTPELVEKLKGMGGIEEVE